MWVASRTHLTMLVGRTPVLDEFSRSWIGLFSHSPNVLLSWRSQTGLSSPSFSPTRWWSRFEVVCQILNAFEDVAVFLEGSDMPRATTTKLLEVIRDQPKCRKLKMELAMTVDAMEPFVKATYLLEGDGPLALVTYVQIRRLFSAISLRHYPNVLTIAKHMSAGDASCEQQLLAYADSCVKPAYDYFKSKFENDLRPVLLAFKAARFFSPSKISELQPTSLMINDMQVFPFFDSDIIENLKSELQAYLAAAEDVSGTIDTIWWWKSHAGELPHWANAFRHVVLVQPSSQRQRECTLYCQTPFLRSKKEHLKITYNCL